MTDVARIPNEMALFIRENMELVESKLLDFPQAHCPVEHHFGPGVYIRQVFMPAGTFAIGHRHRHEHMNVLVKGALVMIREDGVLERLDAPMTLTTPAGRKVAYIVEDCIWQNVYATDEKDYEKLEETLLDKSPGWKLNDNQALLIAAMERELDRDDFERFLCEHGLDAGHVRAVSENEDDQIPMPYGWSKVAVMSSPIEGKGLFSCGGFVAGETICPGRIGGKRTPAGRYVNHSKNPNATVVLLPNGDIDFVAKVDLPGCVGSSKGTEITIDYREVVKIGGGEWQLYQ